MRILVVVDMQNDFIDGALGTKEAEAIVPLVAAKLAEFDGRVLFTRDTHEANYLETQEGRRLPVKHCIRGTKGWEISEALRDYIKQEPIDKPAFGSPALGEKLLEWNREEPVEEVVLVGLCTDICVISNALLAKAFLPEATITVDAACCAGVSPITHTQALEAMKVCQIHIEHEIPS